MYLGEVLKRIRRNRGFTQISVSKNIISQGSYSKFEAGLNNLETDVYIKILNNLNIDFEEVIFIRNSYNYEAKQLIIKQFFTLNYNNIEKLEEMSIAIAKFLKKKQDLDIEEIQIVCNAFLQLHLTRDIELTKRIIQPIWNRISKYEQWYLNDIRMINTILFLFPVNVATEFTQSVLTRLNKYKDFREAELLKTSFAINLSLLLIKEGNYVKALEIIEGSLEKYKKKNELHYISLILFKKSNM